jgi:hypothetical protein
MNVVAKALVDLLGHHDKFQDVLRCIKRLVKRNLLLYWEMRIVTVSKKDYENGHCIEKQAPRIEKSVIFENRFCYRGSKCKNKFLF